MTFDTLILAALIGLSTHWLEITGAIGLGMIIARLWRRMRRAPGDPASFLLACSSGIVALVLLSIFADLSADSGALHMDCPGWLTVRVGSIGVCSVTLVLVAFRHLFRRTKRLFDPSGAANIGFDADPNLGATARRRKL